MVVDVVLVVSSMLVANLTDTHAPQTQHTNTNITGVPVYALDGSVILKPDQEIGSNTL